MRTRWMLAASILFLVMASLPGALRAAEEPGCAPVAVTPATSAVAAVANAPAPAITTLPIWAGTQAPQTLRESASEPVFLLSCSSCPPPTRCSSVHSCVLMGCC